MSVLTRITVFDFNSCYNVVHKAQGNFNEAEAKYVSHYES